MIFLTDDDPQVFAYCEALATMMQSYRSSKPNADTIAYPGGMNQFLLEHGRFWQPAPRRADVKRGTIKHCFDNAYKLAMSRKWRYVEGVAFSVLLPVHHAWVIDDNNNVVDNTWKEVGTSYLGVEFSIEYVREVRKRTNMWPVLDNWKNRDIYAKKFASEVVTA